MAEKGRLHIPQPAPFMQFPGDPPMPYMTWIAVFGSYIDLVEAERGVVMENKIKNSLLFTLLGSEGQRQFGSNPIVPLRSEAATTHAIFKAEVRLKLDVAKEPKLGRPLQVNLMVEWKILLMTHLPFYHQIYLQRCDGFSSAQPM